MSRLGLLFFFSGASGLIYQIVWVREFGNVFGNTIHSASLVIAVFMGGLGVGGWLAGVWADRRYAARPDSFLAAYGYFELAIATLGFAISSLLPHLGDLSASISAYTRDANGWYVLSTGSHLARYAIAVGMLAPITFLMGGTLTLLIRHLVRRDLALAGWKIGALYGANTGGAAAGCFLTDYTLIPAGGLRAAQMVAVLLNLVAAVGALRLAAGAAGSREPPAAPIEEPPATAGARRAVTLTGLAILLSGFAAMGMEIVWFRHMSSLFGSFRSVLSLILTVILLGIWLGSTAGGFLHRRFGRPLHLYMLAQALFVISTLLGLARADMKQVLEELAAAAGLFGAASGWEREALQLWLTARPVLREIAVPALLMGFAYPLANAGIQHAELAVGRRAGLLYLANTLGAVLGALAAGFLLLPTLGMQRSVALLAVTATLGIVPLYRASRATPAGARPARSATAVFAASIVAAGATIALWINLPPGHLVGKTLWPPRPKERRLVVSEGLTEVVAVMDMPGEGRTLFTNGHSMSGTTLPSQRYMRAFAHIPLLSLDAPERVLIICFGVGNTLHAASLHPSVRRLETVDTSRQILAHAPYFAATNGDVIRHPKLAVYVNDGRHHLRMQPEATYDMITMEPPPVAFAGVASLYSREFYELARSRLRPGGYITQWLPAYQGPPSATLSMVRAFIEVFPRSVLLSGWTSELILMGVKGTRLEIDPGLVLARLRSAPAVQDDMTRIHMGTLVEIIGTFAASAETLARATEPYRPVTDDYPIQEYALSSRLRDHRIPVSLFDVTRVGDWCPKCLADGRLVPEGLTEYLTILGRLYQEDAFLHESWPPRPRNPNAGLRVPLDPQTARRTVASSLYLQRLLTRDK